MNQREIDALENCIARMSAGVPLEDCIKQSTDLTAEMGEILKTASDLMNLEEKQVSSEQMERSLTLLLSQAEILKTEAKNACPDPTSPSRGVRIREFFQGGGSLRPLISRMALVLGITALLILVSGGLVITSAKSLPGDSLYPVKLAVEDITVYLVPSSEIRQEYELNYSQQRVDEVSRLIALHRIQRISFEGTLDVKSSTNWIVSGIPILIQAETTFVGGVNGTEVFVNGSVVEVEGITNSQGEVTANEIHLRQYLFTGTVEKMDQNTWQISGIKVSITPRTKIEEGIVVGDVVSVVIRSEDKGLYALSIQSKDTSVSTPQIVPTTHNDQGEIEDPTVHQDIETNEALTTSEVDQSLDSEGTSHEDLQLTAVPHGDGEHDDSSTTVPTESHETKNHEGSASTTPEQHETPEP